MKLAQLTKNIFLSGLLIFSFSISAYAENPYDVLPESNSTAAGLPADGFKCEGVCNKHSLTVKKTWLSSEKARNCYPLGSCKTPESSGTNSSDSQEAGTGR